MKTLTNTSISKLEIKPSEYVVSDTEFKKLKIRVTPAGNKTFYLFWKKHGKLNKYRIGRFGEIGIPAARKAAEKLLAKIALDENPQADRNANRISEKQSAGAVLRSFLDNHYYPWCDQHQKVPQRTRQIIEYNFKSFLNIKMGLISKAKLDNWSKGKLAKGINPKTINRASTALVSALNKAVEWEIINSNPLSGRKRLKTDKNGVVRWLTDEEKTRLCKALESRDGHIALLIPLLLNTGARPSEALSLTWDNVDLKNNRLTLQAAFTKTGQTRYIPINDKLLKILSAQESKTGFLFPNANGSGHIVTVQKSWGTLKRAAKLKNFRLYDCRHSFASSLIMKGADIYAVSELLGHSSLDMTRIYAHLSPKYLKSTVDIL